MIKFLFQLLAAFPLWALHGLGILLGLLTYQFGQDYRRKMLDHVSVLYPEDTPERRRVLRQSAMHSGMALFELPYWWGRSRAGGIARVMRIEGWEHIEALESQSKGMLFLTPHLGAFEATAQIFSTRKPITVLYRPNRNPQVQAIIENSRRRDNIDLAPTSFSGVRLLLKALRQKRSVGLLPDQVPSSGEGVWANVFGRPAYTMTLPGALVKTTQCSIVLALGVRRPFFGVTLKLFPGPETLSADPQEAATQINAEMEALIRQYPEQYYWGYERYKPPAGQVAPASIERAHRHRPRENKDFQ